MKKILLYLLVILTGALTAVGAILYLGDTSFNFIGGGLLLYIGPVFVIALIALVYIDKKKV
jgi:hypothetical protein